MELIIVLLIIAGVFYAGFMCGSYFIRKENKTLLQQVALLESFSTKMASAARSQAFTSQELASLQSTNMTTTLHAVAQTLGAARGGGGNEGENSASLAISDIVKEAKMISKNEFEE